METNREWTVFFLMGAKDDAQNAIDVIKEIKETTLSQQVEIIICIEIFAEDIPEIIPRVTTDCQKKGRIVLFLKLYTENKETKIISLSESKDFSIKSPKDISEFFIPQILEPHLATRYMIFTWGHGRPFALFSNENSKLALLRKTDNKLPLKNVELLTHFRQWDYYKTQIRPHLDIQQKREINKMVFSSQDDRDLLTIADLKNAINLAFGKIKIDLLVISNCYLQSFDTGFELSSCVNYLVAFETIMFLDKMLDYKTVLQCLVNSPKIQSEKIARFVVSSFEIKSALKFNSEDNSDQNFIALFANDLNWYPPMATMINELAIKLIEQLPIYFDKIKNARDKCDVLEIGSADYCLIDFKNFLYALYNELPVILGDKYDFFQYLFQQIVINSYIGNGFKKGESEKLQYPSCFSIYFPGDPDKYNTSYRQRFMQEGNSDSTSFVNEFLWDKFIDSYMNMFGKRIKD